MKGNAMIGFGFKNMKLENVCRGWNKSISLDLDLPLYMCKGHAGT